MQLTKSKNFLRYFKIQTCFSLKRGTSTIVEYQEKASMKDCRHQFFEKASMIFVKSKTQVNKCKTIFIFFCIKILVSHFKDPSNY